jgi:hypothetical protein
VIQFNVKSFYFSTIVVNSVAEIPRKPRHRGMKTHFPYAVCDVLVLLSINVMASVVNYTNILLDTVYCLIHMI